MTEPQFIALPDYEELSHEEMGRRAHEFYVEMRRRRTVREFSDRPVPRTIIEDCVRAAGTSPSGANQQPWHFAIVADAETKHQIRLGAEKEEREFYERRAPEEWLQELEKLGTNANKPYLEVAPYLIAIFGQPYARNENGETVKHYYVTESVGIATGILIVALHRAGLATLTHTPSPMGFLNDILGRPVYERPFLLLVTGYPAVGATVPVITKKALAEIASFH